MAVLDDLDVGGSGSAYSRSAPVFQQSTTPTRRTATATPRTAPGLQVPIPGPQPTPAPAPAPQQPATFSGLNQGAIMNLLQGLGGPSTANLRTAFPQLMSQGLIPQGSYLENKDTADEIWIPGYGWLDTMVGADSGNPSAWQFSLGNSTSGLFNDPIGMWWMNQIEDIMGQLRQPRQLPGQVNEAYDILRGFATQGGGGGGPDLSRLREATTTRANELRADPFSDTEEAAMRVKAFDNMERSRQAMVQQAIERMGAQGHAQSSGTMESAIGQVNNQFNALRAQGENQLLTDSIAERQRRRSEAMSLEQILAEAEQAAAGLNTQAALGNRSTGVGAAQALAQMAQFISSQTDPMNQLMMLLQTAGLVPAYAQQQFQNAQGTILE